MLCGRTETSTVDLLVEHEVGDPLIESSDSLLVAVEGSFEGPDTDVPVNGICLDISNPAGKGNEEGTADDEEEDDEVKEEGNGS